MWYRNILKKVNVLLYVSNLSLLKHFTRLRRKEYQSKMIKILYRNMKDVFIVYIIGAHICCFTSLGLLYHRISLNLCNFISWQRKQVYCRRRDSCDFMGPPHPNKLVCVAPRSPFPKNNKCSHVHLLVKEGVGGNIWGEKTHILSLCHVWWQWEGVVW